MLLREATLDGIVAGTITLAFRRWKRPTVRAGGRLRTSRGVVRIGAVDIVALGNLSERDATASGFADLASLLKMLGPEDGNSIYRVVFDGVQTDGRIALRDTAEPSDAEWAEIAARFARWEKAAPGYFPAILAAIEDRPGAVSGRLAAGLGVEQAKFKHDVRKLKELGLTESLDVGYRLSPRGVTVLKRLEAGR